MNIVKRLFSRYKKIRIFFGKSEGTSSGSLRNNEIVGAIANAIAVNVGKLSPQVIRKDLKGVTIKNDHLSKLIALRPCPEASIYDFLYKMAANLVYTSNSFAIIFYNADYTSVERIQPVAVSNFRIYEDENETLWFNFTWDYDGKNYTVPYQFVIHLKGRYSKKRFIGAPPDSALQNTIDLLETTYQGIKNVVKNTASLRGYLKFGNLADDELIREKVREFQEAYMSAENEGGIAGIDSSLDFKEIGQQPKSLPISQTAFFRDNLYRYYGVNEKILTSSYTEQEWNSFYEQVIEPIAIQLSLEFTFKIFSERERGFGNKIIFTTNRLQYATLQTRSNIGQNLFDRGIITINEYRELMYLPQIDDGDVRMISLNYVKIEDQSLYQTGRESKTDNEDTGSDKSVSSHIRQLIEMGMKT